MNHLLYEGIPELYDVTMFSGTPLWSCCVTRNADAVPLLLQYGADAWERPLLSEEYPIDLARRNGQRDCRLIGAHEGIAKVMAWGAL